MRCRARKIARLSAGYPLTVVQKRQHLFRLTMRANANRSVGLFSKADRSPHQSLPRFFVADARDEAEIEAFETTWSQRGPPGAQPCTLTIGALGVWFFR